MYIPVHNCIVSVLGKPTLWIHIWFCECPYRVNQGDLSSRDAMFGTCRGVRILIVDTRLFPPPATTRMTSNVVVKHLVLFTMLQSFLRTHEERLQVYVLKAKLMLCLWP